MRIGKCFDIVKEHISSIGNVEHVDIVVDEGDWYVTLGVNTAGKHINIDFTAPPMFNDVGCLLYYVYLDKHNRMFGIESWNLPELIRAYVRVGGGGGNVHVNFGVGRKDILMLKRGEIEIDGNAICSKDKIYVMLSIRRRKIYKYRPPRFEIIVRDNKVEDVVLVPSSKSKFAKPIHWEGFLDVKTFEGRISVSSCDDISNVVNKLFDYTLSKTRNINWAGLSPKYMDLVRIVKDTLNYTDEFITTVTKTVDYIKKYLNRKL